jgi:hypothetical protein
MPLEKFYSDFLGWIVYVLLCKSDIVEVVQFLGSDVDLKSNLKNLKSLNNYVYVSN